MNRPYTVGKPDVTVVVPAHNEESNVGPLFDQFGELARRARFSFEVVAVDDGSTDRTLARLVDAQRVHRFLRIVTVPHRRGLTEALQAGFSVAQGSIIVFYPADRQFHPNDIPRMIDKVREGYDLVTGRKIGVYNKRAVSGIYNRISRWLFPSIQVTDLNSVKALRRELVDALDYRHDWHRFWVAIVAEQGYRIGEVDVTLYPRPSGRSKFGLWRIPGGVLDLLAVKFQYHTMRRPLWYFGLTGSALLTAAFLVGLLAVYQRFILNHGYRPLLYLVMTLGISGVVFFALGFLAESVAGIRQQVALLRGGPNFRLYHPPPGSSYSAQVSSAPAQEAHSPRTSGEQRSGTTGERPPRGDRRPGRALRTGERRGEFRRRRESDQRDSQPVAPLPPTEPAPPVTETPPDARHEDTVLQQPTSRYEDRAETAAVVDDLFKKAKPAEGSGHSADSESSGSTAARRDASSTSEPATHTDPDRVDSASGEPEIPSSAAADRPKNQYGRRRRP